MTGVRVLIIDDDEVPSLVITRRLRKQKFGLLVQEVRWESTLAGGLSLLSEQAFDVVFLDCVLPGVGRQDWLEALRTMSQQSVVILLSSLEHETLAGMAIEAGASDYLLKENLANVARVVKYSLERRSILLEMQQAREQAWEASKAKSDFLAKVSHELRTPLNGVFGSLELLLETGLSNEQMELLSMARLSAKSLLAIIGDILDFSKIEAGKLIVREESFSLHQVLRDVEGLTYSLSNRKELNLIVHIGPDVPEFVVGDSLRVHQILVNLLGNSVKFNIPQGAVILYVDYTPSCDTAGVVSFSVADTGIGIPAEKLNDIFSSFEQVKEQTHFSEAGTGLGLAIARELVQLMGGSISVSSRKDTGTCFTVQIPFTLGREQTALCGTGAYTTDTLSILLAEDNIINQKIAIKVLESSGFQVTLAENGKAALQSFDTGTFDVILMDIQMPIMNGEEAIQVLRNERGDKGREVPIIALTANAMTHHEERYRALGVNGFVAKPFTKIELIEEISQVVEGAKLKNT